MTRSEEGAALAQRLWQEWDQVSLPQDPRNPEFARAALDKFIDCLESRSAVDKKAIEGASRSAEQLNVSEFHGIAELIQNADDLRASRVAMRLKKRGGKLFLYVVHDGDPIEIQHVLPIVTAYLTTKEDDPLVKGKFGIGLKTCSRFSDCMDVHCTPYHFRAIDHSLARLPPASAISRFFLNDGSETLFIFRLRSDFDLEGFRAWLERLDTSSLLFLSSVREFTVKISPKSEYHFRLNTLSPVKDSTVKIRGYPRSLSMSYLESGDKKNRWHRYSVSFPVPKAHRRKFKKTASHTTVSVSIPEYVCQGRLFAGLPTQVLLHTPILLDAQFDPDASRERLISSDWNKWLVRRSGDALITAAIDLFARGQACCWHAVPLPDENPELVGWLAEELPNVFQSAALTIAKRATIKVGRNQLPLDRIAYCEKHVEHLVDAEDIRALTKGAELIPKRRRDSQERWRKVLDDFEVARYVDISDALRLFDIASQSLKKAPFWFVDLAYQAISHHAGHKLFSYSSILLEDGRQVRPQQKEKATNILVVKRPTYSFVEDKNIVETIHDVYSKPRIEGSDVKDYFKECGNLFQAVDEHGVLLALANKGAGQPFDVDDNNLVEIRDLFSRLEREKAEQLRLKLGAALRVEAFTWKGRSRVSMKATIRECYLPSSIEKEKHGWSIAAGRTPGLLWLSPRYRSLLATREESYSDSKQGGRSIRKMGSRAFFHALGAETAPRLTPYLDWQTFNSLSDRRSEIHGPRTTPEALRGDSKSEDLLRVLEDICRTKTKKKERKLRGVALFETLSRNWQRCYAGSTHATTGYFHYKWRTVGKVYSLWGTQLNDYSWLVNEAGEPKRPRELGLRTPLTLAVYGNAPRFFAASLGVEGDRAEVARFLGIETDPQASTIVDLIQAMKDGSQPPDQELLRLRYAALARMCPDDPDTVNPNTQITDLRVSQLKRRFGGIKSTATKGLIYANNSWVSVGRIFSGKQIFHGRRIFVPSGADLSCLWKVLGVRRPSIRDCIAVLEEIEQDSPTLNDRAILIETYRYIETKIAKASAQEMQELGKIPLRCGTQWNRKRPIYYLSDQRLAQNVAKFARVWTPPCNVEDLGSFLKAAGVSKLEVDNFPLCGVGGNVVFEDLGLTNRFQLTLRLLREYLALNSEAAYSSIKLPWEELLRSEPRISPHLGVLFRLPGHRRRQVDINTYLALDERIFFFRDQNLIASKEDGGRLAWECFGDPRYREIVELAWVHCWQKAQQGTDG